MSVLTSEFFWGVVVGVVLAAIGAWLQTVFTTRQYQKAQKDLIKNFCIDTVNNLKAIVNDMVDHRQRTQIIHGDYLSLLDIEFNVFGRNREQIIHLPNPVRNEVRKFVTDCATRRAEIGTNLAQFTDLWDLANQLQARGDGPQAQLVRNDANAPIAKANQALDQLVVHVKDSTKLVDSLNKVR